MHTKVLFRLSPASVALLPGFRPDMASTDHMPRPSTHITAARIASDQDVTGPAVQANFQAHRQAGEEDGSPQQHS